MTAQTQHPTAKPNNHPIHKACKALLTPERVPPKFLEVSSKFYKLPSATYKSPPRVSKLPSATYKLASEVYKLAPSFSK